MERYCVSLHMTGRRRTAGIVALAVLAATGSGRLRAAEGDLSVGKKILLGGLVAGVISGIAALASHRSPHAAKESVSISPTKLLFETSSGARVAANVVTVVNGTGASVTVTAIQVDGDAFTLSPAPTLPMSLAAGGQLPVTVRYQSTGRGGRSGRLEVTIEAPGKRGSQKIWISIKARES